MADNPKNQSNQQSGSTASRPADKQFRTDKDENQSSTGQWQQKSQPSQQQNRGQQGIGNAASGGANSASAEQPRTRPSATDSEEADDETTGPMGSDISDEDTDRNSGSGVQQKKGTSGQGKTQGSSDKERGGCGCG